MSEMYKWPIGWSDHSRIKGVVISAVLKWDAKIVEMHLDLDGEGKNSVRTLLATLRL